MLPQQSGNETNIKLPFAFILTSLAALILSQLILIMNGALVSEGIFRIPPIWSSVHLLLLGWALMTAMGAMYQLVPVAFLTSIWSEKFGFCQFAVTALGIGLFSAMLYYNPGKAFLPGVLALLGIVMFLVQMGMTLKKQAKPNILTLFVGSSLVCLFATIFLGIAMAWSIKTGEGSQLYSPIFKSHLLLGTAGWFTLLIFGFSYKMVPMFSLAHGFGMKLAKVVFAVYAGGLVAMLLSFWTGNKFGLGFGLTLLAAGFLLFAWHIKHIIDKRIKKKLDKPFLFALIGIGFGAIIHLAALAVFLSGHFSAAIGPLLYLYIMLWIAMSILGYLYKIVPFLWWTHKYSGEIGKRAVPSLKDMVNDKAAPPLFILLAGGALLVFASILLKSAALFYIGQTAASLALLAISITIVLVLKK
ncbi:hypothetical protein D1B31_06700 [Neobacillus notoginsengisoli]|uniref:Uncharacterized protein n=1 Tax=Neobacillus notoginsengisoli TaxID=1578198 RepID=A0A417YXJ8_9BACI|nr:hypothetical protein [Neobacillus notoginsengisoli]RHW42304.1 hypothetical protein D1B31_06700 [Neobacillus notoginsengisoli]